MPTSPNPNGFRQEKDSIGIKEIPADVYYGVQTARAVENYPISGMRAHPTLITHDAPLVIALAICIGLSYAAVKIGMAAIIGAFFAGLAFAEYSPRWNLQPRVSAINEFLAPFFFFSMGSRLNLAVFDRKLILSAIVISLLAVISKLAGCGLPVLRSGWKHALKVGVGMVPRGEVGLIVALVGLQMTAITEQAYALVIFMTATTTLVAPPLLKILFRDEVITLSAAMHPHEEQTPAMK